MNDELINPRTRSLVQSFISKPSSSVLLVGSEDTGAYELCDHITSTILGTAHVNNILIISPESGKSIGVEKIRELKRSLTTVAGKGQEIARVVIIRQAGKMTHEAQNSLLKLLEEPSKSTLIILLSDQLGLLLETVRSRCQIIKVLPLTKEQALAYADRSGIDPAEAQKAYLLSGGNAQLFDNIVHGKSTLASEAIAQAKAFVSAKPFERLTKQKDFSEAASLEQLLSGVILIAEAGLHGANKVTRHRWKEMLVLARYSQQLLRSSTPPKLVYLHLCTHA